MINVKDLLDGIAQKVRHKIGLEPSDLEQLQKAEGEAAQRMTEVEEQLARLREEAKRGEIRILHRKREHEKETGLAKRMLAREIERMVRRQEPLEREHTIQLDNQDATHALVSKVRELRALLSGRVREEAIDTVAVQLEDAIEAAESAEQAMESLRKLKVRTGGPVETESAAPAPREANLGFSEETAAYLKELEAEQGG